MSFAWIIIELYSFMLNVQQKLKYIFNCNLSFRLNSQDL